MFKPGLSENSIQGQMLSRFTETELCQNEARGKINREFTIFWHVCAYRELPTYVTSGK